MINTYASFYRRVQLRAACERQPLIKSYKQTDVNFKNSHGADSENAIYFQIPMADLLFSLFWHGPFSH